MPGINIVFGHKDGADLVRATSRLVRFVSAPAERNGMNEVSWFEEAAYDVWHHP